MSQDAILSVRAIVTLTIEVSLTDTWNTSAPISQVQEQATASAIGRITSLIDTRNTSIKGKPHVQMVIAERTT